MDSTVVVVPCYNESQRLQAQSFLAFTHRHADIRLLMVDDGSKDQTHALLERLAARSAGSISVLKLEQNQGKGEAVRQGVLAAIGSGADYVGYWDADLATPLDQIPLFRRVLRNQEAVQLVLGARVPLLGHQIRRSPMRGRLGRVFAKAASLALSLPIFDTQCGAKLFRNTPATAQAFAEPFLARWIFDVELIARLLLANPGSAGSELLFEQPLERWEDVAGSRLKLRDFAKAPWELAAIYWKHCRPGARPLSPQPTAPASRASRPAA